MDDLIRRSRLLAVEDRSERQEDASNVIAERLLPLARPLHSAENPEKGAREAATPAAARQVLAAAHNFH